MTPGVPREARSLSGHDLGREVLRGEEWETIWGIEHREHAVIVTHSYIKPGIVTISTYHPHDIVQVRGRDD